MIHSLLSVLSTAGPLQQTAGPEAPPALVVAILAVTLLLAGAAAGRLTAHRAVRSRKAEVEQMRLANEAAVEARSQAVNERERALGELDTRKQEINLLENQVRSIQRQLDQARAAWRAAEKQVEDLGNQMKEARAQIDALRAANVNLEKLAGERQVAVNKANLRIYELEARLADTQSVASERQSLLGNANAQLSRYRSRLAEVDHSASELETSLTALGAYMQTLRRRLSEAAMAEPEPTAQGAAMAGPVGSGPGDAPAGGLDDAPTRVESRRDALASDVAALGTSLGLPPPVSAAPDAPSAPPESFSPVQAEPVIPVDAIPNTPEEASDFAKLQAIKGIGVMYALTLTKSGINTVVDLAASSVEHLEDVIRAPRWRKPDYADWIRQAREALGQSDPA